jgi:hypothetical protein
MNDNLPDDWSQEALENNRRNGLPAKPPTEIRRKQADGTVLTWSSTTPAGAAAWVDDMIEALGLMQFAAEIDSWERDNDRSLNILNTYFRSEWCRLSEALWDRREEVSTLRW